MKIVAETISFTAINSSRSDHTHGTSATAAETIDRRRWRDKRFLDDGYDLRIASDRRINSIPPAGIFLLVEEEICELEQPGQSSPEFSARSQTH